MTDLLTPERWECAHTFNGKCENSELCAHWSCIAVLRKESSFGRFLPKATNHDK